MLDKLADDTDYYKTDLLRQPELAGCARESLLRYQQTRDAAAKLHHYVGELSLPDYYAGFSPTTLPLKLQDTFMVDLEGVNGELHQYG